MTDALNPISPYRAALNERYRMAIPERLVGLATAFGHVLAYLEANPDFPVPPYVSTLIAYVDTLEQLETLAAKTGQTPYPRADPQQITVPIDADGREAIHVRVRREDRPL